MTVLGLTEVGELYLQTSLIQFSVDQRPDRSPTQMVIAATEWKLLAVAHPIKKHLLSTLHNNAIFNLPVLSGSLCYYVRGRELLKEALVMVSLWVFSAVMR